MYKLFSKLTSKLTKKNILDILKLKDTEWKYGIDKQQKFFYQNIKNDDIHNLFYKCNNLIGYTCLRKKYYPKKNLNNYFLHFDTLIIKKKFRSLGLGHKIMNFNNKIIKNNKSYGILICKKNMVKFYEKFYWTNSKKIFKKKYIMFYCMDFKKKNLKKLFNFDNYPTTR